MGFIVDNAAKRWPDNKLPYEIDTQGFPAGSRELKIVEDGIKAWNDSGAATLTPRKSETDYVRFKKSESGCGTTAGRPPEGGRRTIGCNVLGHGLRGVLHEIGHVLGLYHEHRRPERDNYVHVKPEKAKSDWNNYGKREAITVGPYDCDSVMHYSAGDNITNLKCPQIGKNAYLSPGDIYSALVLKWGVPKICAIKSVQFPGVCLRMDATQAKERTEGGAGIVDCQGYSGTYEKFRIGHENGYVYIGSERFPNRFLRMDATGFNLPSGVGGGIVNCQFGAQLSERFVMRQQQGHIEFCSVQFPQAFLRMDGRNASGRHQHGAGIVNAQIGADLYERFIIQELTDSYHEL